MSMKKLYGVITAMTTPFDADGNVDVKAVEDLTEFLIQKGVHCLYPLGTTGEMIKLSVAERKMVAETVIKKAAGRVVVYIHCGAVLESEVIELAQHAEKAGADGIGAVTPLYFGVNDREMETFYVDLCNSVSSDFPVYLYNIPQCAANDLKPEICERVAAKCPNAVGIKYSFADLNRTIDYLKVKDGGFDVVLGPDFLFMQGLTMGCSGVVSGISGVYPEPFIEIYNAYMAGDYKKAEKYQKIAVEYIRTLRGGSNMAYFKAALNHRGLTGGHMRKPHLDLTVEETNELIAALDKIGVYHKA